MFSKLKFNCVRIIYFIIRITHINDFLSDKFYIKLQYYFFINKILNLNNPCTFSEKLNWLKLNYRKPEMCKMVDKFEAKVFVDEVLGKGYTIPTLAVYERAEDIKIEELPEQFVLKCTHDCGSIFICKDKKSFDIESVKKRLKKALNTNYYNLGREWPYKNVKPRIIAEEYISENETGDLKDYKFFCFNGVLKFFKVDYDRFICHRANYYSIEDYSLLPFYERNYPNNPTYKFEEPQNFGEMVDIVRKFADDYPFIRIDLYNINGRILFGEFTFYPNAGYDEFLPGEWNNKLGNLINLKL